MQRRDFLWAGLGAVWMKELADHLSSIRMRILEILILLVAIGAVFAASGQLRATVAQDPFIFLKLFTTAKAPLPSFVSFLGFFIPLIAIGLGFDAINSEYNRRTLSRVLAQPIYRDALLVGKFFAGLSALAILLVALWLVVTGLGIFFLGLPPSGEEVARSLLFLVATLFYAGIWLALAMFFSVVFRQPATSALVSLAIWIFFAVFWGIIAQLVAQAVHPIVFGTPQEQLTQAQFLLGFNRISPNNLYAEAVVALLNPAVRSLGPIFLTQMIGAVLGNPLPLSESLYIVWPEIVAMLAATVLIFAGGYLIFQRREIRA